MTRSQFFQHFDLLADQPDAVAKMRELVLRLAVRGKLLPQNPRDEPASALLEEIDAERIRLVQAKQLEASPRMKAAELPSEPLPLGWEWSPFGRVTFCRDGERIPVNSDEREGLTKIYDYYGASGVIDKIDRYLFDKALLLIGEDGANLVNRSTPIAFIAEGKYWVNNHAHVLDGIDRTLLEFLRIYINSISLEPYLTGMAQPKMNQAKMNSIPVPLPPLAEQRRIVAKVDELMALCDELAARQQARHAARAQLQQSALHHLLAAREPHTFAPAWQRVRDQFHLLHDTPDALPQLRQAILQLAVQGRLVPQNPKDEPASVLVKSVCEAKEKLVNGRRRKEVSQSGDDVNGDEQFPLPNGWQNVQLGEIADIGTGSTPTSTNPDYYENGTIPWVTSSATSQPFIDSTEVLITQRAVEDFRLRLYAPGTILIALYGQGKTRGQVSHLRIAATVNQACATISLPDGFESLRDYIVLVLREQYLKIREQSAGGAQPNLNGSKVKSIVLSLPPLAEQKRIVARVEELLRWCDTLEAHLHQTRTLGAHLLDSTLHHLLAA